jgi:hypothetical protein
MAAEPVRIFVSDDERLPRRLVPLLQRKIDAYTGTIMAGQLEFPKYKELTGVVQGLREALQIAEELSREMND